MLQQGSASRTSLGLSEPSADELKIAQRFQFDSNGGVLCGSRGRDRFPAHKTPIASGIELRTVLALGSETRSYVFSPFALSAEYVLGLIEGPGRTRQIASGVVHIGRLLPPPEL